MHARIGSARPPRDDLDAVQLGQDPLELALDGPQPPALARKTVKVRPCVRDPHQRRLLAGPHVDSFMIRLKYSIEKANAAEQNAAVT